MARIALIGDFNPEVTAHRAIPLALNRAAKDANLDLNWDWIDTASMGRNIAARLAGYTGIWVVPASPYADTEAALSSIRLARERNIPFLGTCGGFQHAMLEYAANVWDVDHPAHAELRPDATDPVIAPLSCGLVEVTGDIRLVPGSRLAGLYGRLDTIEGYHCNYGLSPRYAERLNSGRLKVGARDGAGEVRAVELEGHPFFLATLFQPERSALADRSHPLIAEFAREAASPASSLRRSAS
jgi:CTP synthase (UTP-ammonia lyase)